MSQPAIPLDAIRQPAWVYDNDGRVTAANDLAEAFAGQPLAGFPIAEMGRIFAYRHGDGTSFAPEELPAVRALAGEAVIDLPVTVALADGRTREVMVTASPIREGDAVTGALVVWQDVTERRRAEEGEAQLRALMDHNPCLVFLKDEHGRYVYLNQTYEDRFVHRNDWKGRTDDDFWPAESAALFRENDLEVLASGRIHQFLEDSIGPDGRRYCWLNYKFPFTDARGRRCVGGIGIDATARVRAEEALRESEDRLRTILDNSIDAIYRRDLATGKFEYVSPAIEQIIGTTVEEVQAWSVGEILDRVHPDDRLRVQEEKVDVPDTFTEGTIDYRLRRRDGSYVWVSDRFRLARDGTGLPLHRDGVIRDISLGRQAEEALRESEEKYRNLVELAPDAIMIHQDGAIAFANPAATALLGVVGPETLLGRPVIETVDPGSRDLVTANIGMDLQGEESPITTIELLRDDGTIVTAQGRGAPIPFRGRTAVQVILRDITRERRAEATLREREQTLRGIFRAAPVGIGISSHHHLRTVNDGFCRATGYAPEELVGNPTRLLYPDDETYDAVLREKFAQIREAGIGVVETRWRRKDGAVIDVLLSSSPIDSADPYGNVVTVVLDITDRRRAEAALKKSEEEYRHIVEYAPTGIYEIDYSGPRFRRVNDAMCQILGYTREELMAMDPGELLDEESRRRFRERVQKVLAGGPVDESVAFRLFAKDGREIWGALNLKPTFTDGVMDGALVVAHDITERKASEEALQAYARNLARSNEDLERFAYVASHDLQEPLRSIVSFSQLLERRYKGQLGTDADEYIEFIVEGGNRMQTLILDLLAYSRVNSTAQELRPTDVEVVMAAVERNLDPQLREAGAIVTYDALPTVMADPLQLEQVLSNLVSNAIKFRRPDVPLRVHIGVRRLDGFREFSVQDNGIGIEPEYHDKIFVIFQRLHTKDAYPGTGIGLAIVKRIIERHGGSIRVESTPGGGSTFLFTLPAA